jgi:hypothetical protein
MGDTFGMKSYIWMSRSKNNQCGVATMQAIHLFRTEYVYEFHSINDRVIPHSISNLKDSLFNYFPNNDAVDLQITHKDNKHAGSTKSSRKRKLF